VLSGIELVIRPSARGFIRKYVGSFASVIGIVTAGVISSLLHIGGMGLVLLTILAMSVAVWVLRCREAGLSTVFALLVLLVYGAYRLLSFRPSTASGTGYLAGIAGDVVYVTLVLSTIFSCIVAALTELFRRSITYVIGEDSIVISGGVVRKQTQSIPYHMIGRVVLEQSLLGKLLNYGTIILISPASWGEEYYVSSMGMGYTKIVREVSRDPLKVIYGVLNPHKIYEYIQSKITIPYTAYRKEVEYSNRETEG